MNNMSKRVISLVVIGTMAGCNVVYALDSIKKDEAVYITLTENGKVKERIASEWVHSDQTNIDIKDKSILKDIKNLKGDEVPQINGDEVVWKSNKNDIYYQGKTDKELPLEVKVTYILDDKEVQPKDLAGKSGKLKLKLQVINKDAHTVTVKGKEKKIYTPFTTVSVMDLPLENFKNVKVNSGEILSDGNNQVVTFISFPGMKESLNIKEDLINLDLKDTLELTADVENFKMGPIMITATPKLPDVEGLKDAKDLDQLKDGINELKDASTKLVDGTSKLSEGTQLFSNKLSELYTGYGTFSNGILKLSDGTSALKAGASRLLPGIETLGKASGQLGQGTFKFGQGAFEFSNKAMEFAMGASKLADGASQIAEKGSKLSEASQKLAGGAEQLSQKTSELSKGSEDLSNAVGEVKKGQEQLTQGISQSMGAITKIKEGKEKQNKILDALIGGVSSMEKAVGVLKDVPLAGEVAGILSGGLTKQKEGLTGLRKSNDELIMGITQLQAGTEKMKESSEKISGALDKVKAGQDKVTGGTKELAVHQKGFADKTKELGDGINKFSAAASSLKDPAEKLKDGGSKLQQGSGKLNTASKDILDGSKKFTEGTGKISEGSGALIQGVNKLANGVGELKVGSQKVNGGIVALRDASVTLAGKTKELNDGMKKFDNEGIHKMDTELNDKLVDVEEIIDTKDEIVKLSKEYKSFTGVGQNMDGTVKFIMKTDEIKVPEKTDDKDKNVKQEEKGILEKIKDFFANIF